VGYSTVNNKKKEPQMRLDTKRREKATRGFKQICGKEKCNYSDV
jgi:hypothetical protein